MEYEFTLETAVLRAQQEAEKLTDKLDQLNADAGTKCMTEDSRSQFVRHLTSQLATFIFHRTYLKA